MANGSENKNREVKSFLKSAVSATPAIGSLAFVAREMIKSGRMKPAKTGSLAAAASRAPSATAQDKLGKILASLADVNRDVGSTFGPQIPMDSFLKTQQGGEAARLAWQEAVHSVGGPAGKLLSFNEINEGPANNVYSAIQSTLARNQSRYIQKIAVRFRQNVKSFVRHQRITGTLPNIIHADNFTFPAALRNAELPPELQGSFNRIKSSLKNWVVRADYYTRPGWQERGLGMYDINFMSEHGNFSLHVPIAKGGMLAEGLTQSSMKVAREWQIWDRTSNTPQGPRLKAHEFLMKDFEESILPRIQAGQFKSPYQIQRAVSEMYEKNIRSLENVTNLPGDISHRGLSGYIANKAKEVAMVEYKGVGKPKLGETFASAFHSPSSQDGPNIMSSTGVIPATSPSNLASGVYTDLDPRRWTSTPEAMDLVRRPTQVLRNWIPTPAAMKAIMKTPWAIVETQGWRQDMGPYAGPHRETLYIDPDRHASLMEKFKLGAGESALLNTPENRLESEVFRAASQRLKSIRPDIQDVIKSGKIMPGEWIGQTLEGTPFHYDVGMKLTGARRFETKGAADFHTLMYEEYRTTAEHRKVFSANSGIKGMEHLWHHDKAFELEKTISKQTKNNRLITGYKAIASMEGLRKQPSAHNHQMMTAMMEVMNQRQAVRRSGKLQAFMRNPNVFMSYLSKKATTNNIYSHEAMTKSFIDFGINEARLDPSEFGAVFGTVPSVFGGKAAEMVPNQTYFQAMNTGFARGVSQVVFGGIKEETGAGALASVEPRMFQMLESGPLGSLGNDLSADLMHVLRASRPEAFEAHSALTQTLASIAGTTKPKGDVWKGEYSRDAFQSWIDKGGGVIKSKGMPDVFVPGTERVPQMGAFSTAGGDEVHSLSGPFHAYARGLSRADTPEARTELIDSLRAEIGLQQAPGGKGAGAFLRQKGMLGSRFFTAVSEAGGQSTSSMWSVGIPEKYAMDMFDEMAEMYDPKKVEAMRHRAMAGGTVPGMIWRHPITSPYSQVPVNMSILRGVSDETMTIPWFQTPVRLAGEEKATMRMLSPSVGMGQDFDADIVAARLVNPDLQEKMSKQFVHADNQATQAYVEHMVRMQLISAKSVGGKGAEDIDNFRKMANAARNLATPQEWVGRLSNQFSEVRQAAGQYLSGQNAADVNWMMNWLEEVPTSGKHLKVDIKSFLSDMEHGFRTRNDELVTGSLQNIFSSTSQVTQDLLTKDVAIEEGLEGIRNITGVKSFGANLRGVQLESTISNAMKALRDSDAAGSTEAFRLAMGRRQLTAKTMKDYLLMSGDLLAKRSGGAMAAVSTAAVTAKNMLMRAGAEAMEHKAALGLGFAGSLALATVLSSPKDTIGPGQDMTSTNIRRSSKAIKRMGMPPQLPPQSLGQPSVPNMMQQSASIAPAGESVRMSIRARSRGRIHGSMLGSRLGSSAGGNASVNVNVKDRTSSLSPHILANKLF